MKKISTGVLLILICGSLFAQQKRTPPPPPPKPIKLLDLFKKKNKQQTATAGNQANTAQNDGIGQVASGDLPITQGNLTSGEYCSIILKDGVLYGWGDNSYGQSGVGKSGSNFTPVQITTDNDWKMVTMGGYHTLAIKTDGTLWAWGWGNGSEMGLDQLGTRVEFPTRLGRDTDWTWVSTSDGHTAALKENGTLWVWGNNVDARLGVGPTVNSTCRHPYQVGRDRDWATVVAGDAYTMALKKNGSLWAWGVNTGGCLGAPTVTQVQQAPIQIGTDKDWVKIFTGWRGFGSFGIKKDGTLWAWGVSRSFQLGLGRNVKSIDRPTQVGTDHDWVMLANGSMNTIAIKADGSLWQWGNSQLSGQGDIVAPQKVNLPGGWSSVAVSQNHAVALMNNGRVWAWGGNYYGQLGAGKTVRGAYSNAPAEVKDFPVPVITTKSKKELATILNEETKVLFQNARSRLSIKDKNAIAKLLAFPLSKDKKQFILGADAADYPFDIQVYPTDMNKDGVEEVFMTFGNSYTSGLAGSSVVLFIRDSYGDWHKELGFPGVTPDVLATGNAGYPDLLIGGPGNNFPVWRWNGKEYVLYRNVSDADYRKLRSINAENLSKAYVARAVVKK
jgi:alpha-tubulin suppressor-like RCC1 family protein